jgi:hypothetical protein
MNKSHEAIATLKYEILQENSKEFKVHNLTVSLAKFALELLFVLSKAFKPLLC